VNSLSKRKIAIYSSIAVIVAIAFWFGGFLYFSNSDDWSVAQREIANSQTVKEQVELVRKISLSPMGFSYRFSGKSAEAQLNVRVEGDKKEAKFKVEIDMVSGRWAIRRIDTI
jgi:hypothetical protein